MTIPTCVVHIIIDASAIGGGAGVQGPGVGGAEEGVERARAQDPTVAGTVSYFELNLLQPPQLEVCHASLILSISSKIIVFTFYCYFAILKLHQFGI